MTCVIKLYGDPSIEGLYLRSYDPEFGNGLGKVVATGNIDHAMKFGDAGDVMRMRMLVPRSRRVRDDGLPNRPLSAYKLEIINVKEVAP